SRRVRLAEITTNPDARWVAQQARNLLMQLDDEGVGPQFLIRDRDSKFTREFDEVFRFEGIRVIKAPVRAPKVDSLRDVPTGAAHLVSIFVGTVDGVCGDAAAGEAAVVDAVVVVVVEVAVELAA